MADIDNLVETEKDTDTDTNNKIKIQKNNGKNTNIHPRALAKLEELAKRGLIKAEKKK